MESEVSYKKNRHLHSTFYGQQWNSEQSEINEEESDTDEQDVSVSQEYDTDDDRFALNDTARRKVLRKACGSVKTAVVVDRGYKSSTRTELSVPHEEVSKRKSGQTSCKIDSKKKMRRSKEIEDEMMTFTVDSLTSQWDSDQSASEESANSANQYDIHDAQLLSSKKRRITDVFSDESITEPASPSTTKTARKRILFI